MAIINYTWDFSAKFATAIVILGNGKAILYHIKYMLSPHLWLADVDGRIYCFILPHKLQAVKIAGKWRRIVVYNVADIMPMTSSLPGRVLRLTKELGIATLTAGHIEVFRHIAQGATDIKTIIQEIGGQATLSESQQDKITKIMQDKTELKKLQSISTELDRILIPDPNIIMPITNWDDPRVKIQKNYINKPLKNGLGPGASWSYLTLAVVVIVLGGMITIGVMMGTFEFLGKVIPGLGAASDTVTKVTTDPCSVQNLQTYPDDVSIAVDIRTGELPCNVNALPDPFGSLVRGVDPELIQWLIDNPDIGPAPQTMPAPEDITIDDVTISEPEPEPTPDVIPQDVTVEEWTPVGADDREAREARAAEMERIQQCGDYNYLYDTYRDVLCVAAAIHVGELRCEPHELHNDYTNVVAYDEATLEHYAGMCGLLEAP